MAWTDHISGPRVSSSHVAQPAAGTPLTLRGFVNWTAVICAVLVVWTAVFVSSAGPVGRGPFVVLFAPTFIIAMALAWTGRADRVLPALFATILAGLWPLYRWRMSGDVQSGKDFLFIAGAINVVVVMGIALDVAKRRGWLVSSRRRSRILALVVCAQALLLLMGWPTGIWKSGVFWACTAITFFCLFWPPPWRRVTPAAPDGV